MLMYIFIIELEAYLKGIKNFHQAREHYNFKKMMLYKIRHEE